MTRKRVDKIYRKVRNTTVRILAIILLILLLLSHFNNIKLINALVQNSNIQNNNIHQLEQEVKQLQYANARLESNVVYEHNKIEQLSNKKVKITYSAIKEEPKQDKVHITDYIYIPDPSPVIIGTLATLSGMAKILVPSL